MHLRPTEHLENCKMHTQERQLTRFFLYFTTDLQRKPNRQFFQNRTAVFLRTELEKSIQHIPSFLHYV